MRKRGKEKKRKAGQEGRREVWKGTKYEDKKGIREGRRQEINEMEAYIIGMEARREGKGRNERRQGRKVARKESRIE